MKENLLTFLCRMAMCVAVGVFGLWLGRNYLQCIFIRKSVADRTEAIVRAKPWIADVAKQAGGRLYILVFKKEQVVEVRAPGWTKPRRYEMTGFCGSLGPKLQEGDGQIPEGIYGVEYLNPNSMFHLSLKVSYPNEFDKAHSAEDGRSDLGGDIMIHGGNATVGCIPIGDDAIEELFFLVAAVGKENSRVVISPYDMRKGRVKDLEKSTLRWYPALCDAIYKSLLFFAMADDLPYGQERLERWLYSIEPDDDPGDDEPPYVPHRNRDALTEFRAFFEGSGWTTNQFLDGLILAVTNNLAAANSGDWAKQRTVNRAMWKLSEINHPAVTNFFRSYIDDWGNVPTFEKGAISAMIYYTNLEPDVMSYMRSLCVRTNIYCKAESGVMLDMFETLSTMPDELKPAATNRVAQYMYFAIRHTTKDVTWQDRELANFIPAYSNSIQRLSAMQYVASTIANPRTRALAQQQVDRLSAIPTNQLNDVSWIAE